MHGIMIQIKSITFVRGNLQKISRIRAKIFVGPVAPSRSHVNADVAIAQTLLQREHNF